MPSAIKTFYLATYIDPNPANKTYLQSVTRRVTSQGWTLDGYRIDRWMDVFASSMAEAREKFAKGEGGWNN